MKPQLQLDDETARKMAVHVYDLYIYMFESELTPDENLKIILEAKAIRLILSKATSHANLVKLTPPTLAPCRRAGEFNQNTIMNTRPPPRETEGK